MRFIILFAVRGLRERGWIGFGEFDEVGEECFKVAQSAAEIDSVVDLANQGLIGGDAIADGLS